MKDPMNDSVLDILIYLFENYLDTDGAEDAGPQPTRDALREELENAGFAETGIERALEWLEGLAGETGEQRVALDHVVLRRPEHRQLEEAHGRARPKGHHRNQRSGENDEPGHGRAAGGRHRGILLCRSHISAVDGRAETPFDELAIRGFDGCQGGLDPSRPLLAQAHLRMRAQTCSKP